jgi:hypothetical protein
MDKASTTKNERKRWNCQSGTAFEQACRDAVRASKALNEYTSGR